MKIHHNISQNILSFLVVKIFYFKFDSCPKNKSLFLEGRVPPLKSLQKSSHDGAA